MMIKIYLMRRVYIDELKLPVVIYEGDLLLDLVLLRLSYGVLHAMQSDDEQLGAFDDKASKE